MKPARRLLLSAFTLAPTLLGACASLTPPLAASESLEISGRFVAKVGNESSPGRFFLQSRANHLLLELSTPFGQTQARFQQSATRSTAWVASPSPRELQGQSLDELSEQLLGWPVPVARLNAWLQALADKGHAEQMSDGVWTLTVQERFGADQVDRPRLLHLRNRASDTPTVELRLIVEAWGLPT